MSKSTSNTFHHVRLPGEYSKLKEAILASSSQDMVALNFFDMVCMLRQQNARDDEEIVIEMNVKEGSLLRLIVTRSLSSAVAPCREDTIADPLALLELEFKQYMVVKGLDLSRDLARYLLKILLWLKCSRGRITIPLRGGRIAISSAIVIEYKEKKM